jgi:CRP/FNR family transcriptional regulator, anaerobic regulatory protein
MNPQQMTLLDNSPSTQVSTISPKSDETVPAQFVDDICAKGDWLHLRPQQRVPLPAAEKVIFLREGMLAIDAMPTKGKLQVLDFLVAGDVISAATVLPASGVSFRAITSATLVSVDSPVVNRQVPAHDYWAFLVEHSLRQLARANIHQLLIGRLETEQRVASFILSLALRNVRENNRKPWIELPMSRTDIANYLVINCDTLSRTMMRFCDCALIKRENRHTLRVIDLDGLRKRSPLASLLSALFEKGSFRQAIGVGRCGEAKASLRPVHEDHSLGPLVVAAAQLSRASAEYH